MSDFPFEPEAQLPPPEDQSLDLGSEEVEALLSPQDEIRELIATNEGRLGDVYRLSHEGLSELQIAERLNIATQNFVSTYRYQIEAALDGKTTALRSLTAPGSQRSEHSEKARSRGAIT